MKISKCLLVAAAGLACLAMPGAAQAGRYVWVNQGIYSHWEYQPDASDYSYLSTPGGGQPAAAPGPPKPTPPRPNYQQYQGRDADGRAVFHNPASGQFRTVSPGQRPTPMGFGTTLGEVRKMNQDRPLGQVAPRRPR